MSQTPHPAPLAEELPERRRPEGLRLDPETVEEIAQRVAELLRGEKAPAGLVDAATVARALGLSRATVYERADDLGAVRLGEGPRARLRFDLAEVRERWTSRSASERPDDPRSRTAAGSRPRRRGARSGRSAEPLPIGAAEAARQRKGQA